MPRYTGAKNYCHYRLFVVLLSAVVFCSDAADITLVFNGNPVRIRENSIVLRHDITFISAAVLETHLSLTLKELVPDRQIGICQEDRCIPYMLGDGPNMAWQGNEEYYIPIGHLLDALGGTTWREVETHTLHISLLSDPQKSATIATQDIHDFSLPDINGTPTSLADFRGKKVAVFCWASW